MIIVLFLAHIEAGQMLEIIKQWMAVLSNNFPSLYQRAFIGKGQSKV